MKRRTTQQDLAEYLKLGRSTISMALRDDPRISSPVRKKVNAAAEKLGYQPDPTLAALAAYRENQKPRKQTGNRFGFLYPDAYPERIVSPKFPLVYSINKRAAELGYDLEFFPTDFSSQHLRHRMQICRARGIEGLFLNSPTKKIRNYRLDWSRLAAVTVGNNLRGTRFPLVTPDVFRGTRYAVKKLAQLNFKRPGLIEYNESHSTDFHIYQYGFIEGCRQNYSNHSELVFRIKHSGKNFKFKELTSWIRKNHIDVIIDSDRSQANRHEEIKAESGAAYISLNAYEEPDDISGVAGLTHNRYLIGRHATNLLDTYVRQRQFGLPELPTTLLVPTSWKFGDSMIL